MAYIFGNYLVEFVKDDAQIVGEVFYPGEKIPVGKVTCHFYNYNDHEDKSHKKDDSIHIDILRVQVDHDNKGIGTFLMKKIIEYADKGKIKHVTTTPSPTGRISIGDLKRFYMKFRFGSGFLMKKIEFVDEHELLADVLEMESDMATSEDKTSGNGSDSSASQEQDSAIGGKGNIPNSERLSRTTKANKVGYLTVVRFLDDELRSKNDVLQIGASGAGVYGMYLAKKGHNVTIVESDGLEADSLRIKAEDTPRLNIVHDTLEYVEELPSNSMDAVLCFGPMDECLTLEEKAEILKESYRVCKVGGTIFISFMSNEMIILENTFNQDYDFISGPKYDSITGKFVSGAKRILEFAEIETLFKMCKMDYERRFAAEGVSMLIRDKMEGMTERQFNVWMEHHYRICEKPELMGCTTNIVYVVRKEEEETE